MTDILDLPDWSVLSQHQEDGVYVIDAEYTVQPSSCPKCGVINKPYKHGTKAIAYRDSPIRGLPVRLVASVQRYRCKDCGETFLQPLTGIHPDMRMTQRCVAYIENQCLRDTFIRISKHIGCDDKTVRNVAGSYIESLNAQYKPWLPEWLGIDETQIDGELRCIITDVVNRKPVDMLPTRDKVAVTAWLYQFKDRRTVKGLAIDMWRPYKDAAQAVFPGLPVVIDKFHVVKMANKAMEDIRVTLAKDQPKAVGKDWMRRKALLRMRFKNLDEKGRFNLAMWLDNEPSVKVAYNLKESFYDIYDAANKQEASDRLDAWRASVPVTMKKGKKSFAPLITATKNWRNEILAFFDHPISNGYTEALNGVAKVINRQGRGYSFDVLRARLLFSKGVTRPPAIESHPGFPAKPLQIGSKEAQHAIAQAGNRCDSCHGVFETNELSIHQALPLVEGEKRIAMVVCEPCHRRFHTNIRNWRSSTCTP